MKTPAICLLFTFTAFLLTAQANVPSTDIVESLVHPPTRGEVRPDTGSFSRDGWKIAEPSAQIKWDLGRPHRKGVVEFEIRGSLAQDPKRVLFAAWNEEAATDGDRKTQAFLQIRLVAQGMMLRLTRRGGRSFERATGALAWPSDEKWVRIKACWDTTGGECVLWRDGAELQRGRFNAEFPGLRWLFLGTDNYKPGYGTVPGASYRNFSIHSLEE